MGLVSKALINNVLVYYKINYEGFTTSASNTSLVYSTQPVH